ncbi:MAG: DUF2085 domain-containing protein [Promethearchaeota archaeon]
MNKLNISAYILPDEENSDNYSDISGEEKEREQEHLHEDKEENYFSVIKYQDRIRPNKSKGEIIINEFIRIFFIILAYFFGNISSGYLFFLEHSYDTINQIQIFQFLTGSLILVVLANIWGPIAGGIGGFLGDLIYQFASIHSIKWEFTLIAIFIGLLAGFPRYDKDETLPNLKIMKYFYSLVAGTIFSVFFLFLNNINPAVYITFFISELISFVFLGPLVIVLLDIILKNTANKYGIIYKIILTHHYELDSDHAVPINIGGYNIFVCTRCAGTITGILIGIFIETFLYFSSGIIIRPFFAFLLCIIMPLPGLIDWGTQKLIYRRSNDNLRIITGVLLGIAMHMLRFVKEYILGVFLLLLIYFGIFFGISVLGSKKINKNLDLQYSNS